MCVNGGQAQSFRAADLTKPTGPTNPIAAIGRTGVSTIPHGARRSPRLHEQGDDLGMSLPHPGFEAPDASLDGGRREPVLELYIESDDDLRRREVDRHQVLHRHDAVDPGGGVQDRGANGSAGAFADQQSLRLLAQDEGRDAEQSRISNEPTPSSSGRPVVSASARLGEGPDPRHAARQG